jgi:spermidine/putrescine transport system permease protein
MAGGISIQAAAVPTQERASAKQLLQLLPAIAVIAVFLVGPLLFIFIYSFLTPGTYGGVIWQFSPESYVQFLFERDLITEKLVFENAYLLVFWRSLVLAAVATATCLVIGFPTAYFIATRPRETRNVWVLLVTVPYWVNLLIRTVSMLFILRDEGPINAGLIGAGLIDEPIHMAYTNFAIGLGLVYSYLPFMVLPIYAALERFDFRLMEAAYDLYANRWVILHKVIVPTIRPGVVAGCLLVFIPCLGAFIAPDILGGGKKLMIGNLIALQFQASRNWPFGSAAAVILLTMVLVALIALTRRGGGDSEVRI